MFDPAQEMADAVSSTVRYYTHCLQHLPLFKKVEEALKEVDQELAAGYNRAHVWHTGNAESIGKVWGVLRAQGFIPKDHMPEGPILAFETDFTHASGALLHLTFSSKVCRRVQIGTKTVEEPVYEIQCGDAQADDNATEKFI